MRKEYDTLIRKIADATNLDFYYVERMLLKMIIQTNQKEIEEIQKKIEKLEQSHARIEKKIKIGVK